MALSNIFREPRREITESLVGIAFLCALVYGDYRFGAWVNAGTGDKVPTGVGMIMGVMLALVTIALLIGTHALGEVICGALARRGLELRPKQRYR